MPNKHAARLFVFWKIFPPTCLIRTYTLINFRGKFLPTLLKRVGKIIFYLVPTWLLGPTCLLNSKKISHLHSYLDSMLIRHLSVLIVWYVVLYAASMLFSLWLTGGTHPWVFNESMNEWRWTKSHHQQGGLDIDR